MEINFTSHYFASQSTLNMNQTQDPLNTLHEIRDMMEKSSRFISLSGLSGVFAGIFALIGAAAAFVILKADSFVYTDYRAALDHDQVLLFLFLDAIAVLTVSFVVAMWLTMRQARKKGQAIWSKSAQRLTINMLIPLVTGGVFCLAFLYQGYIGIIAPSMLVFYGLALINGSKYTLHDIRYLGICEIVLGLIATFFIGYGLLFWAIGFGILHIIYGIVMYQKYEKNG